MKVAFGTTLLDRGLNNPAQDGIDGIGQYCQELLGEFKGIPNAPKILPYTFGQNRSLCGASLLKPYARHALEAISKFSSEAFFNKVDLIHSTDQFIPIANKPLLATVMDVIPLSNPEFLKSRSRYLKSLAWKKLTQRADRIITISQFSKNEIKKYFNYPGDLIDVIPLGVNKRYFERLEPSKRNEALRKLGIDTPFFLFLGSIQPRKNLLKLIAAHSQLPHSLAKEFPLVIAGKLAWDDGKTLLAIQDGVSTGRIKWLNYIREYEKLCLLQSASALAFVSHYEGFGLPIIEAFASELPVITSNCTSIPEVAGNAAILVDPTCQDQITAALLNLIEDKELSIGLKQAGLLRANEYSWEANAKQTFSIYQMMT